MSSPTSDESAGNPSNTAAASRVGGNDLGPAIVVSDLHKTYREGLVRRRRVEALRGVSFTVERGEIFGLLGPNGAGKTTLIKVLLGIVRRTAGTASLLGHAPGNRAGRRRVGYLPENNRVPRHHTGNTALEYYGGLSGLSALEVRRRRAGILDMVGLSRWGDTNVRSYSKGMQQRLGIAQALLHEPELLILDEPTDGVDPVGRSEMRSLLLRLRAEGKTIFLNSHHLQEIELVCDRVVIVDHGQVRLQGRIDEITASPETDVFLTLNGDEAQIREAIAPREIMGWVLRPNSEVSVGNAPRGIPAIPIAHGFTAQQVAPSAPGFAGGQFLGTVSGSTSVQVTVQVDDQADINRLVDSLRQRGIDIEALTRHRQTLEEAFLSTLSQAPSQVSGGINSVAGRGLGSS